MFKLDFRLVTHWQQVAGNLVGKRTETLLFAPQPSAYEVIYPRVPRSRRRLGGRQLVASAQRGLCLLLFLYQIISRRHLSDYEVARLVTLLEESHSQRHVANFYGVSHSVVSRVYARFRENLREVGLRSRRPMRVPLLTPRHQRQRLAYAHRYVYWGQRQWKNVPFTDESRFCLHGIDRRVQVWRRHDKRHNAKHTRPV